MDNFPQHGKMHYGKKGMGEKRGFSWLRFLLFALLVVAFLGCLFGWKYNAYTVQMLHLERLLDQKEEQYRKLRNLTSEKAELEQTIALQEESARGLEERIPGSLGVDDFMNRMKKWAAASNVELVSYDFTERTRDEGYREARVVARFAGPPGSLDALHGRRSDIRRLVKWIGREVVEDTMTLDLAIFALPRTKPGPAVVEVSRCEPVHVEKSYWFWNDRIEEMERRLNEACEGIDRLYGIHEEVPLLRARVKDNKNLINLSIELEQ